MTIFNLFSVCCHQISQINQLNSIESVDASPDQKVKGAKSPKRKCWVVVLKTDCAWDMGLDMSSIFRADAVSGDAPWCK